MEEIELDAQTRSTIQFAARLMECSPAEVIRRLVAAWSAELAPSDSGIEGPSQLSDKGVPVHAVYRGKRSAGVFRPGTRTLEIVSGPGLGQYNSPSAAAGAVLKEVNPGRNPNTNGWRFWRLDSNGYELKAIRN